MKKCKRDRVRYLSKKRTKMMNLRRKTGEPQEERIPDINIDQMNQNMACRTPGCNGTFVPIRTISEGLGGAIKIVKIMLTIQENGENELINLWCK